MEQFIDKTSAWYRKIVRLTFIAGILFFVREVVVQVHDTYVVTQDFACLASHQKSMLSQQTLAQASVGADALRTINGGMSLFRENPCNVKFWVGDFSVSQRAWYAGRPGYNRIPFLVWAFASFLPGIGLLILGSLSRRLLVPAIHRAHRSRFQLDFHSKTWPGVRH